MRPSTKIDSTPAVRAFALSGRPVRSGTDHAVTLFPVGNTWDHEAFREFVLASARNAGHDIQNTADLSRVTGSGSDAIGRAMISKWFRGLEQPSSGSLRKLAPAIRAPYAQLLVLAGRGNAAELELPAAPTTPIPLHHPLAEKLDRMLAETSPVPADEQRHLIELVGRVIEPAEKWFKGKRRTA